MPVMLIGLSAPLAGIVASRLAVSRVLTCVFVALAAGIVIRSLTGSGTAAVPFVSLMLGTILIGIMIGVANALLLAVLKQLPMALHGVGSAAASLGICLGAALAAGLTDLTRLAVGGSWKVALLVWAVPALVCSVMWWCLRNADWVEYTTSSTSSRLNLWRNKTVITLCGHMGFQSFLSQSVAAWLPTILIARGETSTHAGLILSVVMAAQLPTAMAAGWGAARMQDQRAAVVLMYVIALAGFLGCLHAPSEWVTASAVLLGLGQGGAFSVGLVMIVLRAPDAAGAARVGALVQFIGYTLASFGPWVFGAVHDVVGSWNFSGALFTLVTFFGIATGIYAGRAGVIKGQ